jgi:SAM-dependent methyltransferase
MEIKMENKYWENNADEYHNDLISEREILLPYIANEVNKLEGKKILDFGCGNGYLASLFSAESEITLYDLASNHLNAKGDWNIQNEVVICNSLNEIKKDYYDIIVQSSVLMCIPTINELRDILKFNYNSLARNGSLVISITHPCFLQYRYGHYKTSFNDENFDYLNNGLEYQVSMKKINKEPVVFTDYNWPLSTIINELLEVGFELTKMTEHPDLPSTEFSSKQEGCPWMFLILKK